MVLFLDFQPKFYPLILYLSVQSDLFSLDNLMMLQITLAFYLLEVILRPILGPHPIQIHVPVQLLILNFDETLVLDTVL